MGGAGTGDEGFFGLKIGELVTFGSIAGAGTFCLLSRPTRLLSTIVMLLFLWSTLP